MRCTVCKRTSDETKLFSGILESDMVMVCEDCAEDQHIPIIRKPSTSQLDRANKRYSVRERMEIMSGVRDKTDISEDQTMTQGNLAKLRSLPQKQKHEDILDNYYWALNMARRRRKMTMKQLADKIQVDPKIIEAIEKGIIPENFEETFLKLEAYLGIKLLKARRNKVSFTRANREAEREILDTVKEKMGQDNEDEEELNEEDLDIKDKKSLEKITISDLLGRKRRREAREKKNREIQEEDTMVGEDLDIEIEQF